MARSAARATVTGPPASGTADGQRKLNGVQTTGRKFRNLSEPVFAIARDDDVAIRMRDGVQLLADVYRPDDEGRHPALISFSPYPRQIQNSRAPLGVVEAGASDFFVPRGYAHVIANARGTSGSGGTWTLLDRVEREDLFELVEWTARQPWCDGNVGMLGISYFAMAQIAAAVMRPPSLKAIFPLGTNESVFDVAWHHGLPSTSFISAWLAGVGVLSQKTNGLWRGKPVELVTKLLSTSYVHGKAQNVNGEAVVAVLKSYVRGRYPESFDRLWQQVAVEHPTYDAFWTERDCLDALAKVDIPVYLGCEWDNVMMHLPGTFTSWKGLAHNRRVRMGLLPPQGLNWPWESLHVEALAWYDHWLKGIDTGIMEGPRIRYFLPVADAWRTADEWPPAESSLVAYALRVDGTLGADEGEGGARAYAYVPAGAGRPRSANPPALPDILRWETAPLMDDVDVVGDIELRLDATITGLDTAWIALLYDVDAQGTEVAITAGWLRASLRRVDEGRSVPGAPVVRCEVVEAVPVGQKVTYRIPIVPNARRLLAGHRLRLVLTSSDDGKGAPTILGFSHAPLGEPSVNTVHSSSRLLVPVLK